MVQNQGLTQLFNSYRELDAPPILILENKKHIPVAALYLSQLNCEYLLVNEDLEWLNADDKDHYYIIIDRKVGIFFSYFRKK